MFHQFFFKLVRRIDSYVNITAPRPCFFHYDLRVKPSIWQWFVAIIAIWPVGFVLYAVVREASAGKSVGMKVLAWTIGTPLALVAWFILVSTIVMVGNWMGFK